MLFSEEIFSFIYTDEAQLSMDNALSVLYIAKKYMLTALLERAVAFLRENLNAENVCLFLPYMDLMEEIAHR